MNGRLEILPSFDALITASAERIAALAMESVQLHGRAMIVLSGGSTPRKVYALMGSEPLRSRIPWENVHVFWGDERCVLPDNPESNFKMVNDSLLKYIPIPQQNIHRLKAETNPVDAAQEYEEEIRKSLGIQPGMVPRFDLVLLGLGEDGHTASLFPGSSALEGKQRSVTEVYVEKFKAFRITMTFPVINNAHHVLFLVSGKGKADILSHVLNGEAQHYPAQRVIPVAGELQWLVDADAASQLITVPNQ